MIQTCFRESNVREPSGALGNAWGLSQPVNCVAEPIDFISRHPCSILVNSPSSPYKHFFCIRFLSVNKNNKAIAGFRSGRVNCLYACLLCLELELEQKN